MGGPLVSPEAFIRGGGGNDFEEGAESRLAVVVRGLLEGGSGGEEGGGFACKVHGPVCEDHGAVAESDRGPVVCLQKKIHPLGRSGREDGQSDAKFFFEWAEVALAHGGVVGIPDGGGVRGEEAVEEDLFFKIPSEDAIAAGLDGRKNGGVGKFVFHPIGNRFVVDRHLPAARDMLAVGNEGVDFALGDHPPCDADPGGEEEPSSRLESGFAGKVAHGDENNRARGEGGVAEHADIPEAEKNRAEPGQNEAGGDIAKDESGGGGQHGERVGGFDGAHPGDHVERRPVVVRPRHGGIALPDRGVEPLFEGFGFCRMLGGD